MDITGVGSVADLVKDALDRFFPSKTDEEKAQMALALTVVQGQLEANKAEASNPSLFVAGWRPFVGWCCGSGCAWNWVGLPVANFLCAVSGHPLNLHPADVSEMMPLLTAMLGLGAYRTYEKVSGQSPGH